MKEKSNSMKKNIKYHVITESTPLNQEVLSELKYNGYKVVNHFIDATSDEYVYVLKEKIK